MNRRIALAATYLATCAAALVASGHAEADPTRAAEGVVALPPSTVTSIKPHSPAWYDSDKHLFFFDLGGTAPVCGAELTWTRLEDGDKTVLAFGTPTLPAAGWQGFFGTAYPPSPMPPGTYEVKVDGSSNYAPYMPPCKGSASVTVVADERVMGATFPRISGTQWEGGTPGITRVGGPDAILGVQIQNYLDGPRWYKPGPPPPAGSQSKATTNLHEGAICTFSVVVSGSLVRGPFPDPYTAVLPNAQGGTSVYRGLIVTPGPWGATLKVDASKIIAQYMPLTAGTTYSLEIRSTPVNHDSVVAPCMGSATATLRAQ